MKYLFFILICFLAVRSYSQNEGYLILEQDQRIDRLIEKQKEIYMADSTIDGYRIQIFMESGNDAVEHANQVMEEFKLQYPEIAVYLIFGQPYYRLRVGDFRTRLQAEKIFLELNKKYKNAFITAERINLPENIFCDDDYILEEQSINNDTIMQIYYYDE
ncbi:MAG: SPOR domain-containing protein [Lentimicrobiaceae bacterium]|nr:SPOR domain-containing protein [Lentimicrobiaceae bacterium]